MVPRLKINASPGPMIRKKPEARSHMFRSRRKRRVSALRTMVFFRRSDVGNGGSSRDRGERSPREDREEWMEMAPYAVDVLSSRTVRERIGVSSSSPLRSSSSAASSISSSSARTRSAIAPTIPTENNKPARKRKNRSTSTSPLRPSWPVSRSSRFPTWLSHSPLRPKAARGTARASPLC